MREETTGRIKVLAAAQPLHTLQPDAHRAPFNELDHYHLGLMALRTVIDSVGPNGQFGAIRREDLVFEVIGLIREQINAYGETFPEVDQKRIYEHARYIVFHLLNMDGGGRFTQRIYDAETRTFQPYSFALLLDREQEDGEFYIEPTTEALNLYFESMATTLEDQHVALKALLHNYMRKGMFAQALEQARNRQRLARRFKRQTELRIRDMRVSLRRVSYQEEVAPLLRQIREQGEEMRDSEDQIKSFVSSHLTTENLEPEQIGSLTAIQDIARDNHALYSALRNNVLIAERTFGEELERQGFRFRLAKTLPDIEEEILMPALQLPTERAGDPWSSIISAFCNPKPSKLFDLCSMIRYGAQPPRQQQEYEPAEEGGQLSVIRHLEDFITNDALKQVTDFIQRAIRQEGPLRLSVLIRAAGLNGLSRNQQVAVALICHDAFKEPGRHGLATFPTDQTFDAGFASGTDMRVCLYEDVAEDDGRQLPQAAE